MAEIRLTRVSKFYIWNICTCVRSFLQSWRVERTSPYLAISFLGIYSRETKASSDSSCQIHQHSFQTVHETRTLNKDNRLTYWSTLIKWDIPRSGKELIPAIHKNLDESKKITLTEMCKKKRNPHVKFIYMTFYKRKI